MNRIQFCYNASVENKVSVRTLVIKIIGFLICWSLLVAAVIGCTSQLKAAQTKNTEDVQKMILEKPLASELELTLEKYTKARSVQMGVVKELILALLDRTETSEGNAILMGKERIRLDFKTPSKSIAVVNGRKGWVIDYPPGDTEDVIRVLRFSWSKRDKKKFLLAMLLNSGTLNESFKLSKTTQLKGSHIFDFLPKRNNEEIISLRILIKDQLIQELEYEDPLNNKTKFNFSNVEFDKKIEAASFELKIPKGAEVTDL